MNIGIGGLLTVIFVIAKITGYITWSWWLVFAPLFAGLAFAVFVFVAAVVLAALK